MQPPGSNHYQKLSPSIDFQEGIFVISVSVKSLEEPYLAAATT